jgi:hypothetical protein
VLQKPIPHWIAGHEAGHVVALWALALPGTPGFIRVVIGQDSNQQHTQPEFNNLAGFVQVSLDSVKLQEWSKRELAIICLAGQIAEGLFREEKLRYWEADIQILFMEGIMPDDFIPETRDFVRQHSREIHLVADRLLRDHQMNWLDVVELIGASPRID